MIRVFWVVTQDSRVVDCRHFESTLAFRGHIDLQDQGPLRLVTSQDAAILLQPSEPPISQKINENLDRVTVWQLEAGAQKGHKEQSNILSNTVYISRNKKGLHVSANQSATFRPKYRNTVVDIYYCILGMRSQTSRDKNTGWGISPLPLFVNRKA
jgi:uncharacterized protein YcbX